MATQIKMYLLELVHGKYYVGQANNPVFRFKEHLAGNGAKWTRLHKPVRIRKVQTVSVENPAEAMLYENWTTLQAMERFGWENVRGGDFLIVEDHLLKGRIEHIYDFESNKIRYYTDEHKRFLFGGAENWLIYVLELRHGRFYIGSSKHLGKSLGEHFCGKSISWTRDNPVIRVLQLTLVTPEMGSYLVLKNELLQTYIVKYGWDKVKGGPMPPREMPFPAC